MPVSYYVYYRVSPARRGAAESAVAELFSELHEAQGVVGRLACRRDDPDTWMEIYEDVGEPQAFCSALEQAVLKGGINDCLMPGSTRMTEIFVPMHAKNTQPEGPSRND